MLAVVLLHLMVLGPLTHPALLPKLSAQHGPTVTYQTERIWHAKATPRLNKSPRLTRSFLQFHFEASASIGSINRSLVHVHSSLMHQQDSVNQKMRDYALQMEKPATVDYEKHAVQYRQAAPRSCECSKYHPHRFADQCLCKHSPWCLHTPISHVHVTGIDISWIMTVYLHTCHHISHLIFRGLAQAMWFLARIEFCCVSVPGKACLGRVIVVNSKKSAIDFCHFPERHGITNSRSTSINIYQPIHNSLAGNRNLMSLSIIVHHCLVYAIVFLCLPPRESRQPRWMHLSLPTASLAAPATEYQRRLDWHEKVSRLGSWYWERSGGLAWMWLAQESSGNGIKQSQN